MSALNNMTGISGSYHSSLTELAGRNDPEAIKEVAKQMEALFAYEMLKAMRNTLDKSSKNGLGGDTYMTLFDMEISKLLSERGLGLQEILLKGISRKAGEKEEERSEKPAQSAEEKRVMKLEGKKTIEGVSSMDSEQSDSDHKKDPERRTFNFKEFSLPVEGRTSSHFGLRKHPVYGNNRFHHGVDIAAPSGAAIYSIMDGKVVFSGELAGYGNVVIIDHGNGLVSKYAHNSVNLVKEGDEVNTGAVIARVGSTGRSTGAHLHFEVKHNGESINPARFIARG